MSKASDARAEYERAVERHGDQISAATAATQPMNMTSAIAATSKRMN
jgi:hypothetical protein